MLLFSGLLTVLGAVALFALLAGPFLAGQVYLEDDLSAQYLPLRHFYAECLRTGESFLWTPDIFCGYYLHGEGEHGMCHPWHWALYRFLPFAAAFDLELLATYPALFAGMYLFLRRRLPRFAALGGAFFFTCCGYPMSCYPWMHHQQVLAHAPGILLCIDLVMTSADRRSVLAGSAGLTALTASQLLVGYPQLVYVTGIGEALYALYLFGETRRSRRLLLIGVAGGLGAAVAAMQLAPTWAFVAHSARTVTSESFRMDGSVHPLNLLQFACPYFFGERTYKVHTFSTLYPGAATLPLVLWLAIRQRETVSRRWLACLAVMAAVGLILALGEYGGLYPLVSRLPLISGFRAPSRHVALFHLAWSALAAFGLADWARTARPAGWKWTAPFAAVALSGLALAVVSLAVHATSAAPALRSVVAPPYKAAVGAGFVGAACLLVAMGGGGRRWAAPALMALAVADAWLFGFRDFPAERLDAFAASVDVPPDAPGAFRIAPDFRPVYSVNAPLMQGYRMAYGYTSIPPARHLDLFLDPLPQRVAGVKWVRARYGASPELADAARAGMAWVERPEPLARARLLSHARISDNPAADLAEIDPAETALVDRPVVIEPGPPGDVALLEDRPGRIRAQTRTPGPRLLVISEAFDVGWRLTINGRPAEPVRAYGDFLGCVVEKGQSEIALDFAPASYAWGLRITLAAVILAVAWHAALARWTHQQGHP